MEVGFIYSMRPVREGITGFLGKKGRRILLPLAVVGTIQFLIKSQMPGVNNPTELTDLWKIYLFRFEQFWFLHAVFLCFTTVVLMDVFHVLDSPRRWTVCVGLAVLAQQTSPDIQLFCFTTGYLYLLPHFLVGCGIQRHGQWIVRPQVMVPVCLTFTGGIALQQYAWFTGFAIETGRYSLLAAVVGVVGNIVVFRIVDRTKPQVRWLARLGGFSYSIFLFHIFGAAGSRIIATKLGLENKLALFTVATTFGLILPIIADLVIHRSSYARTMLLGLKFKRNTQAPESQPAPESLKAKIPGIEIPPEIMAQTGKRKNAAEPKPVHS